MREILSKYIVLLTSMLIVILSVLFALSQNRDETTQIIPSNFEKIQKAKDIYAKQGCGRCHSIDSVGNKRNPLDGVGDRMSQEMLKKWIVGDDSLKDELPRYALSQKQKYKQLSHEELNALVDYMQSLEAEK